MWQQVFNDIVSSSGVLVLWMIGFFAVFTLLHRATPCNPDQPYFHKSMATDGVYFFAMPIINRFVRMAYMTIGIYIVFHGLTDETVYSYIMNGYGPLGQMPIWLQAAVIFIISDIILYWTHRWFHTRNMWRFHAIHHSPKHVYWHSTYRFHPVNVWLSFTLVDTVMLLSGFSVAAVALMGSFNMIYSAMVHANLSWTFGPFKHIFASPVFHRWHHTAQEEGMDKNFAPTFPLLDHLFGTFYMPEGRVPEVYGIHDDSMPESFIGQMLYPFKKKI